MAAGVTYDSRPDTRAHIAKVAAGLTKFAADLLHRASVHDRSKLEEPELSTFDRVTPLLRDLTYDSPEYKAALADMGPALEHHYAHNDHHPEHHADGVDGMNLMQLVEMLCDWKAAGERHADGSMRDSIVKNVVRFGITPQLEALIWNTAYELGWVED